MEKRKKKINEEMEIVFIQSSTKEGTKFIEGFARSSTYERCAIVKVTR